MTNVILCLGDTEEQHQICGFKVGVGWSYRKCRTCYARENKVRHDFEHKRFVSRTQEYLNECNLIENAPNPTVKGDLQTTYGILYRSSLLSLIDFDNTKQLPHDIMLVVLEGVLPYECQLSLSILMEQGLFTLAQFNQRLSNFHFPYSDSKSKPQPLKATVFMTGERNIYYIYIALELTSNLSIFFAVGCKRSNIKRKERNKVRKRMRKIRNAQAKREEQLKRERQISLENTALSYLKERETNEVLQKEIADLSKLLNLLKYTTRNGFAKLKTSYSF